MTGTVTAVCAVLDDVELAGVGRSAINKRPMAGRVQVGELGLVADHVVDHKHHGGLEQAVYVYGDDEAQRWADELSRELPAGWFGENVRVSGVATTDAIVGEQWLIGMELVVECTIPRFPCRTFAAWAGEPRWVKRFLDRADVGTYMRVITPGTVAAGDSITVIRRPTHGVNIRDLITGTDPAKLRELLSDPDLTPKVARETRRALRRSEGAVPSSHQ